jgi:hypothetical protein
MPHSDPFADSITGVELWSFVTDTAEQARSYRDLALMLAAPARALRHPPEHNMAEWDRACQRRPVVAIGGVDAHQIGIRVGNRVPLRLMSYARSFRLLHTHVLCEDEPNGDLAHDRAQVYDALGAGRCYIANDALAPARGFAFWGDDDVLHVRLPRPAEIRLIRNGEPIVIAEGAALDHAVEEPGVHRVEARLGDRTWILSNPIYSS